MQLLQKPWYKNIFYVSVILYIFWMEVFGLVEEMLKLLNFMFSVKCRCKFS